MLPYILAHVPNSCISLAQPSPIYTLHKQWRVIDDELVYVSLLRYYNEDIVVMHKLLSNPVNAPYIDTIVDGISCDIIQQLTSYPLTYDVARLVLLRIIDSMQTHAKVHPIKHLITQHPSLREELIRLVEEQLSDGLYHLVPEVEIPTSLEPWFMCDEEIIYRAQKGMLDVGSLDIINITSASIEVIECMLPLVTDPTLYQYMYYRVHKSLPFSDENSSPEITDYLRLLMGNQPLYESYAMCTILANIIFNEEFYHEEHILHILRNTVDVDDIVYTYKNIESYDIDRTGIHILIGLCVLYNIIQPETISFIQLDDCHICKRLLKKYS